jgi:glucosyl-dolichyl phosphate glucuronosyltransferase
MLTHHIRISAVICTLNRAEYLRQAVKSLVDQTLSKDQYEIIVVDNGSSDQTKQIVLEEFSDIPNIRYMYEPLLGLNLARNTGWKNAYGEYVAYLDDDAIASSQWLESILEGFETIKPVPGCVGGKIEPIWDGKRPDWLTDQLEIYLAVLNLSLEPVLSYKQQVLAGVNMAISKQDLKDIGGFHPDLDRRGSNLLSNGDVLVQLKIMRRGKACYYHPKIVVQHHIHADRLTKEWFIKRMYWEGISTALLQEHLESLSAGKKIWRLMGAACRLVFSIGKLANPNTIMNDTNRYAWKCSNEIQIGYIVGLLRVYK